MRPGRRVQPAMCPPLNLLLSLSFSSPTPLAATPSRLPPEVGPPEGDWLPASKKKRVRTVLVYVLACPKSRFSASSCRPRALRGRNRRRPRLPVSGPAAGSGGPKTIFIHYINLAAESKASALQCRRRPKLPLPAAQGGSRQMSCGWNTECPKVSRPSDSCRRIFESRASTVLSFSARCLSLFTRRVSTKSRRISFQT